MSFYVFLEFFGDVFVFDCAVAVERCDFEFLLALFPVSDVFSHLVSVFKPEVSVTAPVVDVELFVFFRRYQVVECVVEGDAGKG